MILSMLYKTEEDSKTASSTQQTEQYRYLGPTHKGRTLLELSNSTSNLFEQMLEIEDLHSNSSLQTKASSLRALSMDLHQDPICPRVSQATDVFLHHI